MKGTSPHVRGAISTLFRLLAFLLTVFVSCYSGWSVIAAVWGLRPITPHRVFMVGIIFCVVGCVMVAFRFLLSIFSPQTAISEGSLWVLKAQRFVGVGGSLCALVGLVVLGGLGVVMTILSGLTLTGKCVVGIFFAVSLVIPLIPAYELGVFRSKDLPVADTFHA